MVSVERVSGRKALKEFVLYPYRLHAGDPNWVAPLRISEFELLNPKKNPFWDHARGSFYLARQNGQVVGRVACIDDDLHNSTHEEDNLVFFGFFEAAGKEAAAALFAAVEEEARGLGRKSVRGPANPSMNDGAGFQIDAFDQKPYVMMPQSPATYVEWAGEVGYEKVKDLYMFHFKNPGQVPERVRRIVDRARERSKPVVRAADLKRFHEEVKILQRIHHAAWEKNWGDVPFTDGEIAHLAEDLKLIVNPELALFLEYKGEPVAVCIAVPNLNQVLERFDGRLITGILPLLNRKKIMTQARLVILGVLPEYRNHGFDLILIDEVVKRSYAAGILEGECGWTLEDNHAINRAIEAVGGVRHKTYRMVQKDL
ncbi:MAG: hypothetical protein WC972_08935 [Trueperaceae bacterium]|nr:hypothetical protein [Trueperaceae bacterium]